MPFQVNEVTSPALVNEVANYALVNEVAPGVAVPLAYQRSACAGTTSLSVNIGAAGNARLIAIFMGDESTPGDIFQGTVTVDGKTCTQQIVADNPQGLGSHLELHTIDEAGLGASNGTVTVSYSGGDVDWAMHVLVYYGVADDTPVDIDKEDVTTSPTVSVENISSNDGNLVIMCGNNGGTGSAGSWTSPLVERIDSSACYPASAVMGTASGVETTGQTNKTYSVTVGSTTYRSTGIVAVFAQDT